jgi:hypothetical protein
LAAGGWLALPLPPLLLVPLLLVPPSLITAACFGALLAHVYLRQNAP